MSSAKHPNPVPLSETASIGLLAIGASGDWEIAIDEATSGTPAWFMQIDGLRISLSFEIAGTDLVRQLLAFLGEAGKPNGDQGVDYLALGTADKILTALVRDDEFRDRFFV